MKTVTRKRLCGILAISSLAAHVSMAGVLAIGPESFKAQVAPLHGETVSRHISTLPGQVEFVVSDYPSQWFGWAPVNLPVGTVIQRVIYYHGGSHSGLYTSCMLGRVKFGSMPELLGSNMSNAPGAEQVMLSVSDPAKLVILKGYRYFIRVATGVGTSIRGVKLYY